MDGIQPAPEAHLKLAPTPLPEQPPVEVLNALDTAAEVIRRLDAEDTHLHFEVGDDQNVRVQLVDGQGNVIREVPQEQALTLLSGGSGGFEAAERW
jgi:hypothetical protein